MAGVSFLGQGISAQMPALGGLSAGAAYTTADCSLVKIELGLVEK